MKIFIAKCKRFSFFALPFLMLLLIVSCGKNNDDNHVHPYDPAKPVVFEKYTPDSGGVGTKMVIYGDNFGDDTSLVKVTVNGKNAKVVGVNGTRIYVVVPSRADVGLVKVTIGNSQKSETHTFEKKFNYQFRQNVSTVCGLTTADGKGAVKDGTLAEAMFDNPMWIMGDDDGDLYVLEYGKGLRRISINQNLVTTPMRSSMPGSVRVMSFSPGQDTIFIANDAGGGNDPGVLYVTRDGGFMNTKVYAYQWQCNTVAVNPVDHNVFYNQWTGSHVYRWDNATKQRVEVFSPDNDGILLNLLFSRDGKTLYIQGREQRRGIMKADYDPVTHLITNAKLFVGSWRDGGFADGVGEAARFSGFMNQIALDSEGNLYVADTDNHRIRKVTPDGVVSTLAGTGEAGYLDGNPKTSKFNKPSGVYVDAKDEIYVADRDNHRIRKIVVE